MDRAPKTDAGSCGVGGCDPHCACNAGCAWEHGSASDAADAANTKEDDDDNVQEVTLLRAGSSFGGHADCSAQDTKPSPSMLRQEENGVGPRMMVEMLATLKRQSVFRHRKRPPAVTSSATHWKPSVTGTLFKACGLHALEPERL